MKHAFLLVALASGLGVAPVAAQDWRYDASIYGWVPGLDFGLNTPFGNIDVDKSSRDVLSALDLAIMARFAARSDRWSFVADLLHADLSGTGQMPAASPYPDASVGFKLSAISGYALYRVLSQPNIQVDAGVGLRAFKLDLDATLSGGGMPAWAQGASSSWADPLIAARAVMPINDQWFATGFADWGGAGSNDRSWQIYAGVGYHINDHWTTEAGFRIMKITKEIKAIGEEARLDLSGASFGVTYRF